jgi:hypothetical protein
LINCHLASFAWLLCSLQNAGLTVKARETC